MRVPIPVDVATAVMFRHDRVCCVCRERGKAVQIHHIDEDHSNSADEANLAVLCLECHNETQIRGGFGRKLNAAEVIKYRDDWVKRVAESRQRADDMMVQTQIGIIDAATLPPPGEWHPPGDLELKVYIESIPDTMKKAYEFAKPEWDKGATSVVTQATYQVIRVAERLWLGLSAWYPPNHFGNIGAAEYFSTYIDKRYELRRALMEPEGPRTGGTMMMPLAAYGVLLDVQDTMVLTVRMMLTFLRPHTGIDIDEWRRRLIAATETG